MADKIIQVNVRWFDGYYESFECSEVRFGKDLLWLRLTDFLNRHIPLRDVRWFSLYPESHEITQQIDPIDVSRLIDAAKGVLSHAPEKSDLWLQKLHETVMKFETKDS